ncbi:acyl-CoA dehydrogenase family protein [Bradyrhizobium ottawaense]|uniref:acyl-CoA dehydrogenase family protein n=1 Tax=Bradyrhizobium ottawaense TaxID=931866 RepID=UPI003D32272A
MGAGIFRAGAGSDLASLRLAASDHWDHRVLNGQKTWITLGSDANWAFVLARTERRSTRGARPGARSRIPDRREPGSSGAGSH